MSTPIILVNGVKGGTGKTLFAANLAHRLAKKINVGVIDADINSPNMPASLGAKGVVSQDEDRRYIPVSVSDTLSLFSMAMYRDTGDGVSVFTNTGGQASEIVRDAIKHTIWGDVDVLIVDLPAGSGDEFRTALLRQNVIGMFAVTMPNTIDDFRRVIRLGEMFMIPMLGVVENMVAFHCGCGCDVTTKLFGNSEVPAICEEYGFKYLGGLPYHGTVHDGRKTKMPSHIPEKVAGSVFKSAVKIILSSVKQVKEVVVSG